MIKDTNMELAINEARNAALQDEVPIGAMIHDGKGNVIALAGNRTRQMCDPTAHAEINVIRQACQFREDSILNDCTIYVTLEPCPMCAAAIVASRLKRLIYGVSSPKFGFMSSNPSNCFVSQDFYKSTEVYGGFYENEIALLMKRFFQNKRGKVNGNRS